MNPRNSSPAAVEVWTALGRGVGTHPDDGLVLLRAIRDADGVVVDFVHEWLNDAAERNAGRPLLGLGLVEAYGPDATLFPVLCELLSTGRWHQRLVEYGTETHDHHLHRRTFEIFLSDVGEDRVTGQYRDVTDLHRARAALEHQAAHDDLTGVPNRRRLREHLDGVVGALVEGGSSVVVMLADLDRFKQVNDVHGHPAGDRLLQLVAQRMRSAMRSEDLVARYGGDEFVVVCHGVADELEAQALAQRLREAVSGRYRLDEDVEVEVGMSIGIALTDRPVAPHLLLERADRALYGLKTRAGALAAGS